MDLKLFPAAGILISEIIRVSPVYLYDPTQSNSFELGTSLVRIGSPSKSISVSRGGQTSTVIWDESWT